MDVDEEGARRDDVEAPEAAPGTPARRHRRDAPHERHARSAGDDPAGDYGRGLHRESDRLALGEAGGVLIGKRDRGCLDDGGEDFGHTRSLRGDADPTNASRSAAGGGDRHGSVFS